MEASWISQAATKLDDPIMMEWAVHFYNDRPTDSESRERLASLWFNDVTMKRWIESSDLKTLGLLFLYLPPERFSMFASTIAMRWSEWPPTLANSSARVLTSVAPELAAEAFERYLQSAQPWSFERVVGISDSLNKLPSNVSLSLMDKLLPFAWHKDEMHASIVRHGVFKAAVPLMPQVLPRLVDGLFVETEDRLNATAKYMARCLFGHDTYARLYFLRLDAYEVASFRDLGALFENDAPLAEMDEIVQSETPLPAALRLLEAHHGRSIKSSLAWKTIQQCESYRKKEHPLQLAALALAAVAAAFERKTLNASALCREEVVALLALNVATNIHYDALAERLRSFPRENIVEILTLQIEATKETYGGITLARLMGELGWAEFTESLIGCIGESRSDFLCEAAQKALLRIGEPARDALMVQWEELDRSQRIYGGGVIAGIGGETVADFALRRFDDLFDEDIELWHDLAKGAPDLRLIERLRPELRRKQHLIDLAYYCSCRLLDVQSPELRDVRERILHKREQQQNAMAQFEAGEFPDDHRTLHMALRCATCGEVNRYEVKSVVIGDPDKQEKPLIADEFPCLSCGALAEFELQADAQMALLAELLLANMARESGKEYVGPLIINTKTQWSDGSALSIPGAYSRLQNNVRINPNDWVSWFRLGNIMRHINRPKTALACVEKARIANPLFLEGIINHAVMLIDANNKTTAFDVLHRALASSDRWQIVSSQPAEKRMEFAQLFNQLRLELGRDDLPALHPGFLSQAPKAGRNDSCPCGSGKKFKKCCMK